MYIFQKNEKFWKQKIAFLNSTVIHLIELWLEPRDILILNRKQDVINIGLHILEMDLWGPKGSVGLLSFWQCKIFQFWATYRVPIPPVVVRDALSPASGVVLHVMLRGVQ